MSYGLGGAGRIDLLQIKFALEKKCTIFPVVVADSEDTLPFFNDFDASTVVGRCTEQSGQSNDGSTVLAYAQIVKSQLQEIVGLGFEVGRSRSEIFEKIIASSRVDVPLDTLKDNLFVLVKHWDGKWCRLFAEATHKSRRKCDMSLHTVDLLRQVDASGTNSKDLVFIGESSTRDVGDRSVEVVDGNHRNVLIQFTVFCYRDVPIKDLRSEY